MQVLLQKQSYYLPDRKENANLGWASHGGAQEAWDDLREHLSVECRVSALTILCLAWNTQHIYVPTAVAQTCGMTNAGAAWLEAPQCSAAQ